MPTIPATCVFDFHCQDKSTTHLLDRLGIAVSEAFDLEDEGGPKLLAQFLYAFDHATPEERGHDTTVTKLSSGEDLHKQAREKLNMRESDELFKIRAWGDDHEYISAAPVFVEMSPTGRGTRGFPIYDPKSDKLLYMKDTWRSGGLEKEGNIYQRLLRNGVTHIPQVLMHGDVPGHITKTWTCKGDAPFFPDIIKHPRYHSRLVLPMLRPLTEFRSTREMVNAVNDALIGR